jgi:hypothetical protein
VKLFQVVPLVTGQFMEIVDGNSSVLQEKEHHNIRNTFLTFAADVDFRKMILIYSSPVLLLELLGFTHPGILEWI